MSVSVIGLFIICTIGGIVVGGFVLTLAELINVAIRIEGHLDRIRELQEREAFITSASAAADALSGHKIAE